MKTNQQLIEAINADKDIQKAIKKMVYGPSNEDIIRNAVQYIKAIKEGRMCCVIHKVSSSGMSRNISFHECDGKRGKYHYYNFNLFFLLMGYTQVRNEFSFRIGGCGMDMIFHTNYTIIHRLYRLGFITKKQCEELAQMTPTVL